MLYLSLLVALRETNLHAFKVSLTGKSYQNAFEAEHRERQISFAYLGNNIALIFQIVHALSIYEVIYQTRNKHALNT